MVDKLGELPLSPTKNAGEGLWAEANGLLALTAEHLAVINPPTDDSLQPRRPSPLLPPREDGPGRQCRGASQRVPGQIQDGIGDLLLQATPLPAFGTQIIFLAGSTKENINRKCASVTWLPKNLVHRPD